MRIARVVGNVVSTIKNKTHSGMKLMIIEQVDCCGNTCGIRQIVADAACAGEGDYVLVVDDGGASRIILDDEQVIIDSVIVGVLDNLFDSEEGGANGN